MAIHRLLAGNPSEWTGPTGTNTWLVDGREPALVDAGVGRSEHIAAIAAALGGATLARVLVTHGHRDHVDGVPAIRARWPDVEVRPSAGPLADGEMIPAGDGAVRAVHTPGHAPDHWCFFDESTGDLFCGDLVRAGGTVVIPARQGGSLREYLDSLRRVRALSPRRLLPGHGPIVERPEAIIDEYLAHREQREREIAAALERGATTVSEMVEKIYAGLPAGLRVAAEDSVLAHLIKLREEGRAIADGSRWLPAGRHIG
ncbi:MAG TPA: MBL fold metallo-hydrolase [Vicinamibacterales bacterium]|nr:MBL fold metallo-hydrolase [Vicinamibacterales bacterium]